MNNVQNDSKGQEITQGKDPTNNFSCILVLLSWSRFLIPFRCEKRITGKREESKKMNEADAFKIVHSPVSVRKLRNCENRKYASQIFFFSACTTRITCCNLQHFVETKSLFGAFFLLTFHLFTSTFV